MLSEAVQGNIDNKTLYKKVIKILGLEVSSSLKVL